MNRSRRIVERLPPGRVLSNRRVAAIIEGVNRELPEQVPARGEVKQQASRDSSASSNVRPGELLDPKVREADPVIDPTSATSSYIEVSRTVSIVRIENPEDETQYVDVERTDAVTLAGPDGYLTLIFNNG